MSRLARSAGEEKLINVITEGIDGTEMPTSRLDKNQIQQVAAFVRGLGVVATETVPGNAQRGEQLYSSKGNCSQCHVAQRPWGCFRPRSY